MEADLAATPIPSRPKIWPALLLAVALVAMTFALFAPTLRHGFVDLDDGDYVYRNRIVLEGLTWPSVRLVFTQPHAVMYAPVLWLSYMLDVDCFGTASARGFHFTNVLLHALNAGLLFFLLFSWSRKPWRAFFFAALWAWHPLRIESVAWIAERKDVLSGLFFLLCLAAYAHAKRPAPAATAQPESPAQSGRDNFIRRGLFLASFVFFALGLLVKPSLVPVPGLLLLLDFWPLRRLADFSPRSLRRGLPRLLLEKLPFFLLSATASMASTSAHRTAEAIAHVSPSAALKTIPLHYGFYLFKIFRPHNLSVLYPNVRFTRPDFLFALLLLAGLSFWAWNTRRQRPNELVGWLWFLGLLVPVIGLIQFGVQSVADRFTYLPAMGLSVALLFVFPTVPVFRRLLAPLRAALAIGLLGLLVFLTLRTLPVWENTSALFQNVLRFFPDNPMALCQQASQRIEESGDFGAAEILIDRANRVAPATIASVQIKALCLSQRLGPAAAYAHLLDNPPDNAPSDPGIAEWNLAVAAFCAKRYDAAIGHADAALRIMPVFNYTRQALFLLAMAAAYEQGDEPLALSYARRFSPYRDKTELALPDLMPCYLALWVSSRRGEALDYFRRLVEAFPDRADLLNNVAWGLATAAWSPAPPGEVLEIAQRMQALHPAPHPVLLDTLAAAQANAGDFAAAGQTVQAALAVLAAPASAEQVELARHLAARLRLYRNNEPYREDSFRRLWTSMLP